MQNALWNKNKAETPSLVSDTGSHRWSCPQKSVSKSEKTKKKIWILKARRQLQTESSQAWCHMTRIPAFGRIKVIPRA